MKCLVVVDSTAGLSALRKDLTGTIGFVPTMGALHAGHTSMFKRARRECDVVIASIFVNPAQFNDPGDLEKYPRPIENDLAALEKAGVDYVFLPKASDMYADDYRFEVREKVSSRILCGAGRQGHFEGVLTVVLKLFNLVRPAKAYFGEKDYQQLKLISDMSRALFLDIEVVPCPTLREPDGLAMSSRNIRLRAPERELAPRLYATLKTAPTPESARRELENAGLKVE